MDYEEIISEEEQKLLAKQAKCKHGEYKIFIKCQDCGKAWSEKNLHIGLTLCNEEIKKKTT